MRGRIASIHATLPAQTTLARDPRAFAPPRAALRTPLLPLAATPALIALALLWPGPFDPLAPMNSAPDAVWAALGAASLAPALTVVIARRVVREAPERNAMLLRGLAATLVATAVTAGVCLLLGEAVLARGGAARVLVLAAVVTVAAVAGAVAADPGSRFFRGLLAGELVVALLTFLLFSTPAAPDEELRQVMARHPGWGRSNLAVLARRSFRLRNGDPARYAGDVCDAEALVATRIEDGSFAPPHLAWADDARVVRAWLLTLLAAAPDMAEQRTALRVRAADELGAFAGGPDSVLEPFTHDGVLARVEHGITRDLDAEHALRDRIAFAWRSLETYAVLVDDREAEARAQALVRSLFEKNGLDRTDPIYLATYSIDRRRLIEAGNAPAFVSFFETLAQGEWPDHVREKFASEAAFVREHPDFEHAPVMALLRARLHAHDRPDEARRVLLELLATWPGAAVAPQARLDLAELAPAATGRMERKRP